MSNEVIELGRAYYGVTLDRHTCEIKKTEVGIETFTDWRGRLVRAEITGDRYTTSSGLSEWRYWVPRESGNGYVDSKECHYSREGWTDTARQRINERLRPFMPALIEQATTGDRATAAIIVSALEVIKDAYRVNATLGKLLEIHGGQIGAAGCAFLRDYAAALRLVGSTAAAARSYADDLKTRAGAVVLPELKGVTA